MYYIYIKLNNLISNIQVFVFIICSGLIFNPFDIVSCETQCFSYMIKLKNKVIYLLLWCYNVLYINQQ